MISFKTILSSFVTLFLCAGLFCSSASAAMLIVEDGQLMGADDVDVNGTLYDVLFLDGAAEELFSANGDDFAFTSLETADIASQSLLDQVLLDDDSGLFDSAPETISGISSADYSLILTPYGYSPRGSGTGYYVDCSMIYNSTSIEDSIYSNNIDPVYDTENGQSGEIYVWAAWSEAAPVPIPGAVWLLGSGILGMIGIRRKIKH